MGNEEEVQLRIWCFMAEQSGTAHSPSNKAFTFRCQLGKAWRWWVSLHQMRKTLPLAPFPRLMLPSPLRRIVRLFSLFVTMLFHCHGPPSTLSRLVGNRIALSEIREKLGLVPFPHLTVLSYHLVLSFICLVSIAMLYHNRI